MKPTPVSSESSFHALVEHTTLLLQRLLLRWFRDPVTLVSSLILPAVMLVMLNLAIGNQIAHYANQHDLYGPEYRAVFSLVPMTALIGVMAGSMGVAGSLLRERDAGFLARMWVLPVHRWSGLIARVIGEGIRILVGTIVLMAVGSAFGFRFHAGLIAALGCVALPMLFGMAFVTLVTTVAVHAPKGSSAMEILSFVTATLAFFSTGFVPLDAFPEFLRGFINYQPLTTTVDAMRGLSFGGPVAKPLVLTLAWCLGTIAVFALPAATGYRKLSRR